MERFYDSNCDVKNLNSLSLAFLGDCVYELLVREKLICESNKPVGKLHSMSIKEVCCQTQALAANKIMDYLSEDEKTIYKRGRNAHTHHTPKNATVEQYHSATGLETLFGYLYLQNNISRIQELFNLINT